MASPTVRTEILASLAVALQVRAAWVAAGMSYAVVRADRRIEELEALLRQIERSN